MGYVFLQIALVLLGHVSLRELNVGHFFHQGHLLGGVSPWGVLLSDLSFEIHRVLISYK